MIKHILLLLGISATVAYIGFVVAYNVQPNHAVPSPTITTPTVFQPKHPNVSDLFVDVNKERVKAGEPALIDDPRIDTSAANKCAAMVQLDEWSHVLSDGRTPQTFLMQEFTHWTASGENLSWNNGYRFDSQATVNSWMASPGHKANILDTRFTNVGYAICSPKGYPDTVVQEFVGEN